MYKVIRGIYMIGFWIQFSMSKKLVKTKQLTLIQENNMSIIIKKD